ncbi:Hypothetical predicted protein [Mytilus galloprovincialis]|uniref:Exonuclease domain-containing protein n=1 Tax=Mytilus galloprovincialis TaxID=29158 RepID=A0A8B6BLK2_MYTGA|nr:Hypothetical predicted protein [Mytilus galloprovincialis]
MSSNPLDDDKSTIKISNKRKHKKVSPEPSTSKRSKQDINSDDKKKVSKIIYKRETDVPVVPKTKKKKTKTVDETPIVVYFDLETTGLDVQNESLTQIAAQFENQTFSVYIKPRGPVGPWALENTHLNYDSKSLTLYYKGKQVTSKKPQDAFRGVFEVVQKTNNSSCTLLSPI